MDLILISAVLALVFVSISTIVGILLILKYFKSKDKTLLYVGLTWIIIVEAWMPSAVNLIYMLMVPDGLSYQIRALIGNVFLPFGLILWTLVFTELVFTNYKKLLLILFSIFSIVFEIILFYAIITDISLIIIIPSHDLNMNYKILWVIFQLLFSVITLVSGLAFSWKSIKHDNPEIKLRGKILFIAFISFLIGALLGILDLPVPGNIIMITSSIEFYIGYILPDWVKNRFIK